MITKELERVGIPTVQISTMTPIALMVGSNRIIPGAGIVHPMGDANLSPDDEKRLRLGILEKALEALTQPIHEQTLFN